MGVPFLLLAVFSYQDGAPPIVWGLCTLAGLLWGLVR